MFFKDDVRFGSKADICGATSHVRFAPNCDRKSGYLRFVMSALPLKADMCSALAHVRFGPIADIRNIHSITSSARPISVLGTVRPSALATLRLIINSTFVAC
jgi:hypothetical protein